MNYDELFEKYNLLLNEKNRLTEENSRLKAQLGITDFEHAKENITKYVLKENTIPDDKSHDETSFFNINNTSDSISKIKLFMSLFKGRNDVYATRWENKKKATSGYSPVCLNQWQAGLCGKPKSFIR
ncbi:MAG: hypothetical protein KKC46_06670 [Proteobacteria bacterium]|nr:hypothetical protein [Pseudomonadota bacterium]